MQKITENDEVSTKSAQNTYQRITKNSVEYGKKWYNFTKKIPACCWQDLWVTQNVVDFSEFTKCYIFMKKHCGKKPVRSEKVSYFALVESRSSIRSNRHFIWRLTHLLL